MFGRSRGAGTTGPPSVRDICNMLDQLKLKYRTFEDKNAILVPFEGKNSTYECFILVDQERAIVYLAIGSYFRVPTSHPRLNDVLYRLMELNWELSLAKLEWDSSDGEVRMSHAITTEDGVGTTALGVCINYLIQSADKHYNALRDLID
jgi:hypothetical protein